MFRRLLAVALVAALVGCGGDDGGDGPSATVGAADRDPTTTSTTEALTPEEEVEAAYLKSWEIYAEAVRKLDDSLLEEVYAGDALTLRRSEIADYRAANTPGIIDVDHDYEISILEPGRALVVDEYVNHSVFIDPTSEEPTEEDPSEVLRQRSELRESEGVWRVVYVAEL